MNESNKLIVTGHPKSIEDVKKYADELGLSTYLYDETPIYRDNNIEVDFDRSEIKVFGKPVKLRYTEFKLLSALIKNPDHVCTYQNLLDTVFQGKNYDGQHDKYTLRVHVSRLRIKIEKDSQNPEMIQTVNQIGYKFVPKNQ